AHFPPHPTPPPKGEGISPLIPPRAGVLFSPSPVGEGRDEGISANICPLTLTLSRRERGYRHRFSPGQGSCFLPLPLGEGRGEGISARIYPLTLTLSQKERDYQHRFSPRQGSYFLPLPWERAGVRASDRTVPRPLHPLKDFCNAALPAAVIVTSRNPVTRSIHPFESRYVTNAPPASPPRCKRRSLQ